MRQPKILVPLDFSDTGKYALQAAQKFAALFDGMITPFHAYVPVTEMYNTDLFGIEALPAPMQNIEEIEVLHRDHLLEFSEKYVNPDYLDKPIVSVGNPPTLIIETAHDFDLIVMSSHGRSGFSRFFLGSVSDKVLRTAHLPVLTVNKEKQLTDIKRIMLATDFSDHSKEAFPITAEIAHKTNAKVELIHIFNIANHEQDEAGEAAISHQKQQLDELASTALPEISHLVETKLIVSTDTPHEAILNENLTNPHDLVIMATVGRTGIDYLMMGSTTANVVRHVKSPVLSINPRKKADDEKS